MPTARPLILIAQPVQSSPDGFAAIRAALAADGKDSQVVQNYTELVEGLRDPSTACAFLGEGFVADVPALIRAARQVSAVEWYFVTSRDDRALGYRVIEAGVRAILTHPLAPFQYVQRVRQVLAAKPKAYPLRRGRSEPAVTSGPRLESIVPSADFRVRRPEWGRLAQTMVTRAFSGGDDLRRQCEGDLLELARCEPRSALGLLSVRPDDPLAELPPARVRWVASSDLRDRDDVREAREFPEVLKAIELDRAVVWGESAAIPLRSGGKITGMLRVRLGAESMTPETREFLADLAPFAGYFVPAFARMDFLKRVYRQLESPG